MAGEVISVGNLIEVIVSEIERRGGGTFLTHLTYLKDIRSRYFIKPKSQPLSEFSMVLAPHRYYLAHYFPTMQMMDQCAMLIHESVHDRQHQNMGSIAFYAKYATFSGRYELELEAHKEEFRWYWVNGWLLDPVKLYAFADLMVSNYKKRYVTLWWFNKDRQKKMRDSLLSIVDENPNV